MAHVAKHNAISLSHCLIICLNPTYAFTLYLNGYIHVNHYCYLYLMYHIYHKD